MNNLSKKVVNKNNVNKRKGMLLVGVSTLIIACAQVFLKKGSQTLAFTLKGILLNYFLISGIFLYALATVLFIIGLKYGKLSTLYPVLGLGYIWVCAMSYFVFNEVLTIPDMIGICFIIFGISLLGVAEDG